MLKLYHTHAADARPRLTFLTAAGAWVSALAVQTAFQSRQIQIKEFE